MSKIKNADLHIRISDELKEKIKLESQKSNLSMSEYVSKQLSNKKIIVNEGLKETVYELRKIGNNLNQIAKKLNLNNSTFNDSKNLYEIKNEVNKIWQSLNLLK